MERRAVSEIYVVPPVERGGQLEAGDLKAYLERFFPRYTFTVQAFGPFQDEEDFVLIPLAGIAGGQNSDMFIPVSAAEWAQMYDAVRSYGKELAALN